MNGIVWELTGDWPAVTLKIETRSLNGPKIPNVENLVSLQQI